MDNQEIIKRPLKERLTPLEKKDKTKIQYKRMHPRFD